MPLDTQMWIMWVVHQKDHSCNCLQRQPNSTENKTEKKTFFSSKNNKLREFIAPAPPLNIFQSWGLLHSSLSQFCNQKLQPGHYCVMVNRTISQPVAKQAADENKSLTPLFFSEAVLSLFYLFFLFLTECHPRSALTIQ